MDVNEALIDKLANLGRLHFTQEEKKEAVRDLQQMISFVEKLNELDLEDTEPLQHMTEEVNVLRADIVKGAVGRDTGLKNAPVNDGTFFQVPKVIKK